MDEVASIPVDAEVMIFKASAFLGLILGVILVVLSELIEAMGKLASFFIGTVAIIHVLLAEL